MLAIALGLGSSLCWGLADFFGGLQSRRRPLLAVLLVSQVAALVLLLPLAAFAGGEMPDAAAVGWAALAGTAGTIALAAFYRGLAIGTMSVVAPVSAAAAVVPVLVGLAEGERPGALQVAGMVLAFAGIVLASREPSPDGKPASRAGIGLALVAALGFGTFFVGIDRASEDAGVLWVIAASRTCGLAVIAAAVLARRPAMPREGRAWGVLLVIGVLDLGANALYAYATTKGLLSIVAVLGSLYPAVTVVLARVVLSERVTRPQEAGVLATLAGVVAISAG